MATPRPNEIGFCIRPNNDTDSSDDLVICTIFLTTDANPHTEITLATFPLREKEIQRLKDTLDAPWGSDAHFRFYSSVQTEQEHTN